MGLLSFPALIPTGSLWALDCLVLVSCYVHFMTNNGCVEDTDCQSYFSRPAEDFLGALVTEVQGN